MNHRTLILFVFFPFLLTQYELRADIEEVRTWEIEAHPSGRMDINLQSEDIEIRGSDTQSISLEAHFHSSSDNREEVLDLLNEYQISLESSDLSNRLEVKGLERKGFWSSLFSPSIDCKLTLIVPRESSLNLKAGSSNVILNTLDGNLTIRVASGDVTASDSKGSTSISTASGNVVLHRITGHLNLQTASGDVDLKAMRGDVVGKSASGDLTLQIDEGSLNASTVSGDILVVFTETITDSIVLNSVSGDIRTQMSKSYTGKILLHSVSGDLACAQVLSEKQENDNRLSGVIGKDSTLSLSLKSISGDLSIQ